MEIKAKVPKWLRYAVSYYHDQLDVPEDDIVEEALMDVVVNKLEARRKIKEATTFPRPPPAPEKQD